MKQKFSSRKFLLTLAGVITVIANDYFDLGMNGDTVFGVVSMVAAYILGEGYVDGKRKEKGE